MVVWNWWQDKGTLSCGRKDFVLALTSPQIQNYLKGDLPACSCPKQDRYIYSYFYMHVFYVMYSTGEAVVLFSKPQQSFKTDINTICIYIVFYLKP